MIYGMLVVLFVVSAVICHVIAGSRGRNRVLWGVLGLVFGPLAIPFVLLTHPKR